MTEGFTPAVRALILERDTGRCVRCYRYPEVPELHHRKLRSRGGRHTPSNGVTLCGPCHRSVHAEPVKATNVGLMVPSWHDPLTVPVHGVFGVVLLDDEGGMTLAEDAVDT